MNYRNMQRTRKAIKSRAGCARCKQRRIKCDERTPACLQCSKRGFDCPGYKKPVKWSSKHEAKGPNHRKLVKVGTSPVDGPHFRWFNEGAEKFHAALQGDLHSSLEDISQKECFIEHNSSSSPLPCGDENSLQTENQYAAEAFALCEPFNQEVASEYRYISNNDSATTSQTIHCDDQNNIPTQGNDGLNFSLIPDLTDTCTSLSNYYFSSVCRIISGFDSLKNPLRQWSAKLLSQNSTIHHCVLSISAAHLAQQKKDAHTLALDHITNALSCLATEISLLEDQISSNTHDEHELLSENLNSANVLLFGIIMLGMTSSWYDSSSLGLEHLKGARILMRRACQMERMSFPLLNSSNPTFSQTKRLLGGFMAYWEAVASFIVDQDMDTADYLLRFCDQNNSEVLSVNPWSGISAELFIYLSKVGSIARQRHHLRKLSTSAAISSAVQEAERTLLQKGRALEVLVCGHTTPRIEQLEDTGDCFTPIEHFQTLARVYRLAILLELYRMFPELLAEDTRTSFRAVLQHENHCQRLNVLAINILSLIASIPDTSGTRAVQMLALIIAGSTLRNCSDEDTDNLGVGGHVQSMFSAKSCIKFWRTFVEDRLHKIDRYVGLDTVRRASRIIRETWKRAEEETLEPREVVHWIDVMVDKGLQTLLG